MSVLANADGFTEKLRRIFRNANYAVILNSEKYINREFTKVECNAIIDKAREKEDYSHIFIININDYEMPGRLSKSTYVSLKMPENKNSKILEKQINWIISSLDDGRKSNNK